MKVHFYEVKIENSVVTVGDVLARIQDTNLHTREREVGTKPMFLERCHKNRGLFEMDFTQRRMQNGPGYSERGRATLDFDLGRGGFGEQTGAIWSPRGFMAVQYNHYGVRPGSVAKYLSLFLKESDRQTGSTLTFDPVIDSAALARLMNSERQKKLVVGVDPGGITRELARNNIALHAAMMLREQTGAGRVELELSLGHGRRGRSLRGIVAMVNALRRQDGVSDLKATVEDINGTTEVLDFLRQRETMVVPYPSLQLTTPGRRLTYESRIRGIRQVFSTWLRERPDGPRGQ